jgi:hypothetical protein
MTSPEHALIAAAMGNASAPAAPPPAINPFAVPPLTEEQEAVLQPAISPNARAQDPLTGRKGGKRPTAIVSLDHQVYEAVARTGDTGSTKTTIADFLQIPESKAYLSLVRLEEQGLLHKHKTRRHKKTVWSAI